MEALVEGNKKEQERMRSEFQVMLGEQQRVVRIREKEEEYIARIRDVKERQEVIEEMLKI